MKKAPHRCPIGTQTFSELREDGFLNIDKTARETLEQIDIKEYDKRFALCGLPVVKIGANFSTTERILTEWMVEE